MRQPQKSRTSPHQPNGSNNPHERNRRNLRPFGDTFEGSPTESRQYNLRIDLVVRDFPAVRACAMFGGYDAAYLRGYDPVNDTLIQVDGFTRLFNGTYSIRLEDYEDVQADPGGDGGPAALLLPSEPPSGLRDAERAALAHAAAGSEAESSETDDQNEATESVFQWDLWR
jgi:hypothetical protein